MKILYNLAGTFNSGGMERIVIAKVNALTELGHSLTIVTTEQRGRIPFFEINPKVKLFDLSINYSSDNGNLIHKLLYFKAKQRLHKKRLKAIINNISPDIIVSTFGNEVNIIPKIHSKSKTVLEIHFSKFFRCQENRKGIWHIIDIVRSRQDEKIVSKYDRFVVLTQEDKEYWGDNIPNIEVIPNFIERTSQAPALLENKRCIAVGRLTYQKGFDTLVKIWKKINFKHPDWTLTIYGNGELHTVLQNEISDLNLEKSVILRPSTPKIDEIYDDSSVLLMSSRYEGFSLVIAEAMSHGVPVVSFACKCGPRDIITDGKDGFLVNEGDMEDFADKIILLIENYKTRHEMGHNAYESSKRFSKEKIMAQWNSLFSKLIAG